MIIIPASEKHEIVLKAILILNLVIGRLNPDRTTSIALKLVSFMAEEKEFRKICGLDDEEGIAYLSSQLDSILMDEKYGS